MVNMFRFIALPNVLWLLTNILNVCNQEVAILRPANGGGVYVLDHEPEQVLVPLKDKVPQVPLEEVLCPIEEGSRRLNWGHKVN